MRRNEPISHIMTTDVQSVRLFVDGADFPLFQWIHATRVEALFLHLFADRKPEFDELQAVFVEHECGIADAELVHLFLGELVWTNTCHLFY